MMSVDEEQNESAVVNAQNNVQYAECVLCGRKQEWGEMDGWDFGVDVVDIEADGDGGVRGAHFSCVRDYRERELSLLTGEI